MQIFIKDLDFHHLCLTVSPMKNILELKKELCDKYNLPYEYIRLYHGGKQLMHHQTLKDFGIKDEFTITMTFAITPYK